MYAVCVHVHVVQDRVEEFIAASLENARGTIREPGNLRFDVIQQEDDPTRFVLYEVWQDGDAMVAHKATDHYKKWAETVADWMAEPRRGVKHVPCFPTDPTAWATPEDAE